MTSSFLHAAANNASTACWEVSLSCSTHLCSLPITMLSVNSGVSKSYFLLVFRKLMPQHAGLKLRRRKQPGQVSKHRAGTGYPFWNVSFPKMRKLRRWMDVRHRGLNNLATPPHLWKHQLLLGASIVYWDVESVMDRQVKIENHRPNMIHHKTVFKCVFVQIELFQSSRSLLPVVPSHSVHSHYFVLACSSFWTTG